MDKLSRLAASLQNQMHKIQSSIFVNIFKASHYNHKDPGVVLQLTKTTIFIATPLKKNIFSSSCYQTVAFINNLLTEKLWI